MSDEQHKRTDEMIARKDETVARSREARDKANTNLVALRKAIDTLASTQIDMARIIDYPRWTNWTGREKE